MRVAVLGCAGRMGRAVMAEVLAADDLTLCGGLESDGHAVLGEDLGRLAGGDLIGLAASADEQIIAAADVVIEFSAPGATVRHAGISAAHGTAHVIGTTGLAAAQAAQLAQAAKRTAIVWAANMSLGVNLLLGLTEQVARALADVEADPELLAEVFGPATLLVRYGDENTLPAVADRLEGQLTATVHAEPVELEEGSAAEELLAVLVDKAGRLIVNQYPTGVEVGPAMVHGGPYPATSDGRSTSVGTRAIERFTRYVAYQNFPAHLLPEPLRTG